MQHTCYCVTAHNQPLERMDVTTPPNPRAPKS